MLFKNIQYAVWKADIIPLLILSLDEFNIITTNDILYCLGNHLVLADIIKDQIILIKGDFLTVRNITCVIYQKYDKKCIIQVFFIWTNSKSFLPTNEHILSFLYYILGKT